MEENTFQTDDHTQKEATSENPDQVDDPSSSDNKRTKVQLGPVTTSLRGLPIARPLQQGIKPWALPSRKEDETQGGDRK